MTGFIYAISDGNGLVKIGWSRNPISRFVKVQSDNAARCSLHGVIEGSRDQEAELHDKLAPHWERGEWFRREGAVTEFLDTLSPIEKTSVPRKYRPGNALREYRIKHGLTLTKFGEYVGASYAMISRIERKNALPSVSLLLRIYEATDGEVTPNDFFGIKSKEPAE